MSTALERAVGSTLLTVDGETFRFRHSLTREAVLAGLLPPRRAELAGQALAATQAAHPEPAGSWRDLAADLAAQADNRERAGILLTASGRESLDRGALATAVDTLRRAAGLLDAADSRADAEAMLVEALALAGRGGTRPWLWGDHLIAQLRPGGAGRGRRARGRST